jgi:putative DNA primase/helicase
VTTDVDTDEEAFAREFPRAYAALGYGERGWKVLPVHWITDRGQCSCLGVSWTAACASAGKHPMLGDWTRQATGDPQTIAAVWAEHRSANIGIATGAASGFWVLDVDEGLRPDGTYKQGLDSLVALTTEYGDLPDTHTVRTGGGGTQYYFRMPPGTTVKSDSRVFGDRYPDIDVKGDGGQVVAPPSVSGKGAYRTVRDAAVAVPPGWLTGLLREFGIIEDIAGPPEPGQPPPAPAVRRAVPGWLAASVAEKVAAVRDAAPGTGNATTNRMAYMIGQYIPRGWISRESAEEQLLAAVRERGTDDPRIAWTIRRSLDEGTAAPYEPPVADEDPDAVNEMHRGQLRMAERLAVQYTGRLLHAHGVGWHVWDGQRWTEDKDRFAVRAVVDVLKTSLRGLEELETRARDALYQDVRKCESAGGIEGILKIASSLEVFSVAAERLDADGDLFNTAGGTLDLTTGEIRPPDPDDLITKLAPFTPGGDGTEFRAFVAEVLPDDAVRRFVQRLVGYAMLGRVTEHVMPIFTGEGANGKSTLRDAVKAAFGDYSIEVDPEMLIASKHEGHSTERMDLMGARMVFISETEAGRRFDESTMKRLTGGEDIRARRMRMDPVEFAPTHTLVMITNKLPRVSDDPACWRRLRVVPFERVFTEDEQDHDLPQRLCRDGGAVLAWALEGLQEFRRMGLRAPGAVAERTAAYRADTDALGRFLGECTVSVPRQSVKASELFQAWAVWCSANNEYAGNSTTFGEAMVTKGHERRRGSSGNRYMGLSLQDPEEGETL